MKEKQIQLIIENENAKRKRVLKIRSANVVLKGGISVQNKI
jgi:hypothetical protein